MVKISIDGFQAKGDALILNGADIHSSGEIDIAIEQVSTEGNAEVLNEVSLEETAKLEVNSAQSEHSHTTVMNTSTVAKGVGSFLRDIAANVASGFITGK